MPYTFDDIKEMILEFQQKLAAQRVGEYPGGGREYYCRGCGVGHGAMHKAWCFCMLIDFCRQFYQASAMPNPLSWEADISPRKLSLRRYWNIWKSFFRRNL